MPYDATFNAKDHQPRQGGGAHPVGNKFPFKITDTKVEPTKDNKGGMFVVEFTSPAGSIVNRYNLWNESDVARRIANEQLSALCHATGIFTVDFKNDGAALRNGQGLMDINFQKGHEPSAEKPEGGYVELKKVYDSMGNEPGKAPAAQTAQGSQQGSGAPSVQTGFQANPTQNNAPAANSGGSWGGQVQPNPTPAGGEGWNQGSTQEAPPWSKT